MRRDPSETVMKKSISVKNFVMAVAIIVGGGWSLYTFWQLETVNRSRAELEELNTRIFSQPVLQIEFDLRQEKLKSDPHHYIAGHVSLKNVGKKNALIKFENVNPPFTATEVSFDKYGKIQLGKKYGQYPPKYAGYGVRAGDTEKIPFFLQVGKSGLYFVDFEVSVIDEEFNGEINDTVAAHRSWASSLYVKVDE